MVCTYDRLFCYAVIEDLRKLENTGTWAQEDKFDEIEAKRNEGIAHRFRTTQQRRRRGCNTMADEYRQIYPWIWMDEA